MKNSRKSIGAMIITIALLMTLVPFKASADISFAILPRLNTETLYGMFKPLAEYLTNETGEKVSIIIPKDFDAFKDAVESGQADLGFANSLIYVQLRKNSQIEPLALASELKAGKKFRGIIIARKDSSINKIQDLKGKKLVFVEKTSAGGYIFQMLMLTKAEFDINKDFVTLPFAKKHDIVTQMVFNREADAGGIREDDLEKMVHKVDLSQIRIVGYSDYFPNWPLFATPKLDKHISAKIKAALLKLKSDDAKAKRILNAADLSGFYPVSDSDYDELRRAAKLVGAF